MALTDMSEEIGAILHDWANNYGRLYRSAHCAVFDKIGQYFVWRVIWKYKKVRIGLHQCGNDRTKCAERSVPVRASGRGFKGQATRRRTDRAGSVRFPERLVSGKISLWHAAMAHRLALQQ